MTNFNVCIVDDDPMARMVAADALAGHDCTITECESGEECLALFPSPDPFGGDDAAPPAPSPDIVLLDINMPGLDGYEVCRRLRAAGHNTQIIFVSGRDDLESRLAGFDAGGSDFIVKPYSLKELHHHVAKVEAQSQRLHEKEAMLAYAQKTAFSAMSSMGEMGAVLQFMRDSFACATPTAVADKVLTALRSYGLNALVALRLGGSATYRSPQGECTELEISILDYASKLARIQQLGRRLVVNYPGATLVVLDLPLDDSEKVDRLRDHLAIITEGAEARLQSLASEADRAKQTQGIRQAIVALSATFADIERQQETNRQTAHDVASQFNEKLLYAFLGMGLSGQQEHTINALADEAMGQIVTALNSQAELAVRLKETSQALTRLIGTNEVASAASGRDAA